MASPSEADLEFKDKLTDIFADSRVTNQQIEEAISIVLVQQESLSSEEKLEEMINLLVESGDSTLMNDSAEEGATGITVNNGGSQQFGQHFDRLLTMFPEICPNYLTEFCRQYIPFNFDQVLQDLSDTDYARVEKDPLDVWEHLKQMLPNADPIYLRNQARVLVNRPPGELEAFMENAIEQADYPTMQEYLIKQELERDVELYITKFSVDLYLQEVPNPVETFTNPNRKPTLSQKPDENDLDFALTFLSNHFGYQRKKEIEKIFFHFDRNLIKTFNRLKVLPPAFRHPRPSVPYLDCKNVELMKEISFLKNEKLIRQVLKQKDERYRLALEEARIYDLLQTCACCYDDQLIPEECYFCKNNCTFCKECVRLGAENIIGKEETTFPCLADCDSEFEYATLQMVLDGKTFQGICHRKQIEEIRNANIDGLETCPFCDYCMIPDQGDRIFKCANYECMAETCRLCQHKAHVPLRCNEIEYDEDVKMRTFIENKMTEALLRKCWKCSKQFYKESGCNKMTCVCGAKMCYVCGQAVTDYTHFNRGQCTLYTENLQQFHLQRVRQGAQLAKDELGVTQNPESLKYDPTRNLEHDVV